MQTERDLIELVADPPVNNIARIGTDLPGSVKAAEKFSRTRRDRPPISITLSSPPPPVSLEPLNLSHSRRS